MLNIGILFNDIHSYDDLNLILSDSYISPAKPKTNYIDIPGGDGSVDATEANGEVKFYDRDLKYTFTMHPQDTDTFEEKKTEVSNLLNGKLFKITQDKDEDYYYIGRCEVDDYLSDRNINQIVIIGKVKPYKYKQTETVLKFDLSNTEKTVNITNGRKSVSPFIECTDDNTEVTFGQATFNLSAGAHKILDIYFKEGNNQLKLSGSGTVTFKFQEGDL